MFVVFEGIDGSGKTTLSGRVAEVLADAGLTVHQARPKGELKSRLAQDIRTLARNPQNLTMSPHTELFLFIARDTQTIDTVIRPQLEEAQVVIADRYLFSAQVLCRARGQVPIKEIDSAVDVAARGLWPDLVVYCDVDIDTSSLRKGIDKIVHPKAPEDFGRKGLRGLGLRDAMRNAYLNMAKQNPDTWFVVDNAHAGIEENTYKIANRILAAAGRAKVEAPPSPARHESLSVPTAAVSDFETPRNAFYDYMNRLIAAGRHAEAAYHLRSMNSEDAWQLREKLIEHAPEVTVYGLGPLCSQRALEMRQRMMNVVPGRVARSLGMEWAETDDAARDMRLKLAKTVPTDVALSLGSYDTERSWELRDMLIEDVPMLVLASLKGIDSDRAWQLRNKWEKKKNIPGLLKGLAGLDNEKAWKVRDKHKKNALPWFILSLREIETDRAWDLRAAYLENATKLVVRSMAGSTDPRAWQMRHQAAPWAKEALTTIKGIDTDEAWTLRRAFKDRWPGAAAKSVGLTLGLTETGFAFLQELVSRHPTNPDPLHYLAKAIEAKQGQPSCTTL